MHLLFQCNYIKTLWCKLEEYLKCTYEHIGSLDFSVNARIVNDVHVKAGNIVNLYALLLKQISTKQNVKEKSKFLKGFYKRSKCCIILNCITQN